MPGDQATLELPPGTGLGLIHHVLTGEAGSSTTVDVERAPNEPWLDVTGSIAADAKPASRDVAVANPTLYFVHSLLTALVARGIGVNGLPRDQDDSRTLRSAGPRRVLVESQSPPLRDIAPTLMKG